MLERAGDIGLAFDAHARNSPLLEGATLSVQAAASNTQCCMYPALERHGSCAKTGARFWA
jgi:hypothetical protein